MTIRTYVWGIMLAVCVCSRAMALSPIEGDWIAMDDKTGSKRAMVHLSIVKGTLNGTVLYVYPQPGDTGKCSLCPGEFKNKPMEGLQVIWGLKDKGDGVWDDGHILDGKNGKIYRLKMSMSEGKLYLRGYIGISLIGRTQVWERG